MNKKSNFILFILIFVFITNNLLFSIDIDKDMSNFEMGLIFKAGSAEIKFTDSGIINELAFLITALRVDFELSSYLKIGVIAGYQQNHFKTQVNAVNLPLSLSFPEENSNSMVLGFAVESEPFSVDDFVLGIHFEFDYYKSFLKSWNIALPIATGTAESRNSFYTASLSFLVKYEGFSTFTPYIGPSLNLISGTLNLSESIMELNAVEDMSYKQNSLIGLSAGIKFEFLNNWDIGIRLNLFSEKSIYISAFYIF